MLLLLTSIPLLLVGSPSVVIIGSIVVIGSIVIVAAIVVVNTIVVVASIVVVVGAVMIIMIGTKRRRRWLIGKNRAASTI